MPCPVCDHTMHNLGLEKPDNPRVFWCPRCGTIKSKTHNTDIPRLVDTVREFMKVTELEDHSHGPMEWKGNELSLVATMKESVGLAAAPPGP